MVVSDLPPPTQQRGSVTFFQLTSGLEFCLDLKFPQPCDAVMEALAPLSFELVQFVPFACLMTIKTDYFFSLLFTTLMVSRDGGVCVRKGTKTLTTTLRTTHQPIGISFILSIIGLAAKARAKAKRGGDATATLALLSSLFLFVTYVGWGGVCVGGG